MDYKLRLAYGKNGLELILPYKENTTIVESCYVTGLTEPMAAIHQALQQPQGTRPLVELAKSCRKIGIVFSHITRPTPNQLLLAPLLVELGDISRKEIILFNSAGTHRANTAKELAEMLGTEIASKFKIIQNDPMDKDAYTYVGTTRRGNPIRLHKEFVSCDLKILTGSIEPHCFTGFTGGGKALLPGLAYIDTIMQNYCAAHLDDPRARWGVTYGNPVWEEIQEATALVKPDFLLNVTLNRDNQITSVFAGKYQEVYTAGCSFVKQTAMIPLKMPFDIVITSNAGYPSDLNVYQSVRGMSAAAQVVKPGGSIIITADCWDGIPAHGEYKQLLMQGETVEDLLKIVRDPHLQKQDKWQVHIQALISQKAKVFFYTHNLIREQIEACKLLPCTNIKATIQELVEQYGPEATICVLLEGPRTIPYVL
jgi:nickel-dependent lactate racemase